MSVREEESACEWVIEKERERERESECVRVWKWVCFKPPINHVFSSQKFSTYFLIFGSTNFSFSLIYIYWFSSTILTGGTAEWPFNSLTLFPQTLTPTSKGFRLVIFCQEICAKQLSPWYFCEEICNINYLQHTSSQFDWSSHDTYLIP